MKKISYWISGICFVVSFIISALVISSDSPSENWAAFSFLWAVFIGIFAFFLSYMGGHIIKGNKGAIRIGALISALWLVMSFVGLKHLNRYFVYILVDFLKTGIIPLVSYWGILWVISGFLPSKTKKKNS